MSADDVDTRLAPAQQRSAEDAVTDALREAIRNGVLAPGTRLAQAELADQLGVSRIPLRDALRRLEVESLVRIDGRRGAFVTSLDPDDVAEIYEIRLVLEQLCVSYAVERINDEQAEHLIALSEAMDRLSDELIEGSVSRRTFYEELYSHAGRPRMARMILQLRDNVSRYHIITDRQHSHAAHAEMRRCIQDRDSKRAAEITRLHLEDARDDLLDRLQNVEITGQPKGTGGV